MRKQRKRKKNLTKAIKSPLDKRMNEKNKGPGNPNWGGFREESRLIKKYADQWCRDNGYPIQKRYYVYREKINEV